MCSCSHMHVRGYLGARRFQIPRFQIPEGSACDLPSGEQGISNLLSPSTTFHQPSMQPSNAFSAVRLVIFRRTWHAVAVSRIPASPPTVSIMPSSHTQISSFRSHFPTTLRLRATLCTKLLNTPRRFSARPSKRQEVGICCPQTEQFPGGTYPRVTDLYFSESGLGEV